MTEPPPTFKTFAIIGSIMVSPLVLMKSAAAALKWGEKKGERHVG